MAKKSTSSTRGASPTASNAALSKYKHTTNPYNITPIKYGVPLELDRRFYRPDESTRPPSTTPLASRITLQIIKVRQKKRAFHAKINRFTDPFHYPKTYVRTRLGFSIPRRVEACIRRQVRKEVIHAHRKNGKSGQRKPVRNFWSAISCGRKR